MEMFNDFRKGRLDVSRVNYGIITLLAKKADADRIQQYRPISCLYKWITKVLMLRLEPLAVKLILKNQSAFMKIRNIMTGVMAVHEILHETKKKNEVGIILKLDFKKTYDKAN